MNEQEIKPQNDGIDQMDDHADKQARLQKGTIGCTFCVAILLCGTAMLCAFGAWFFDGVDVVVRNEGQTAYTNCRILVTGNAYDAGELNPGESVSVRVVPTGESHVELELISVDGSQANCVVDCYFERSHDRGTITIDVADGKVKAVDDQIHSRLFWL